MDDLRARFLPAVCRFFPKNFPGRKEAMPPTPRPFVHRPTPGWRPRAASGDAKPEAQRGGGRDADVPLVPGDRVREDTSPASHNFP